MSSEDNSKKAQHGEGAKESLDYTVDNLIEHGALKGRRKNPSYGREGHDPSQFKADEEVTTSEGSKYILYSTNSIRSDRVKGQQWDASNIKAVDESVEYAYIIVPDAEALEQGGTVRDKIRDNVMYSAIDDILTSEEFKEQEVERYNEQHGLGVGKDLAGRNFESQLCKVLDNEANLRRFNGDDCSVGYLYESMFRKIMDCADCKPGEIRQIAVTSDIPKLPSGGNPKTDVAATLALADGSYQLLTFSLKNTSSKQVSVHEYSADDFADVLDKDNTRLRALLEEFQRAGSVKAMREGAADELEKELKPYLPKLDTWVFSGEGAADVKDIQCAQFLVLKSEGREDIAVHSIEDYCNILESQNDGTSGLGTIFQWTYPSKKRGEKIQLKANIVL